MKRNFIKLIALMVLVLGTGVIMAQTYTFPVKGSQGFALSQSTRDGAIQIFRMKKRNEIAFPTVLKSFKPNPSLKR